MPSPPEFLFQHGLLGYAWKDEDSGEMRQRFNVNDPDEPASLEEFRTADFFLLHPCADSFVNANCPLYKREQWNIVGHGKPFSVHRPGLHVHFGAGQLGCGLVVPVLKSRPDITLCIIQRPSERWRPLLHDMVKNIKININHLDETESHDFTVVSDEMSINSAKECIRKWTRGERDILVLSKSSELIDAILRSTQSISTVGRIGAVRDIATQIVVALPGRRVASFPFENDEYVSTGIDKSLLDFRT
ncbi:MAG: hypothetical protein ACXW1E_08935 [Halobacteriota archaeon]